MEYIKWAYVWPQQQQQFAAQKGTSTQTVPEGNATNTNFKRTNNPK